MNVVSITEFKLFLLHQCVNVGSENIDSLKYYSKNFQK